MIRTLLLLIAALLGGGLAGCMSLPADPAKMTPEQLKAAKESSVSVTCTTGTGPWGAIRTVMMTFDAKVVDDGAATVGTDCSISMVAKPKVVVPVLVQSAAPSVQPLSRMSFPSLLAPDPDADTPAAAMTARRQAAAREQNGGR